jgi:hypothetical protein
MLLYVVAIAICAQTVPDDQCSYVSSHVDWEWVYRPNVDACIDYASQIVAFGKIDMTGKKARVYCIKAEAIQDAYSQMLPQP